MACLAAVTAAGALGGYLLSGLDHPAAVRHVDAAPASAPVVQPVAETPLSIAAPPRAVVPHDAVAASTPTAFTLTGPKFTIKAHVCAMANIRPYDPPGEQRHTVCWVRSGFGVAPSSRQPGTSYLFGHSWAEDSQEVLNKASSLAMREVLHVKPRILDGARIYPVHVLDSYRLVLRTRTGTLTYQVRSVYGVRKLDLRFIKSWDKPTVPGRVLLTTCGERNGVDYDYNVVIEAHLLSSVAAVRTPRAAGSAGSTAAAAAP